MPSQLLPVSNRLQSSAVGPPSSASAATMLLKAEIQDDPSTSIIVSSQFEDEKAVTIRPLLTRASSYNNTIANNTSVGPSNQQRRRRIASDSSLALLADDSPRGSFRQDVGHAAAETFLVTRLSVKLLRYLGYPSHPRLFFSILFCSICVFDEWVVSIMHFCFLNCSFIPRLLMLENVWEAKRILFVVFDLFSFLICMALSGSPWGLFLVLNY